MRNYLFIIGLLLGMYIPVTAQSPLCPSYPTTYCCEYVSSVNINGVVRDGAPDATGFISGPGYFDYTADVLTSMTAGNSYPVSVTVKTNSTYQEYVKMWFDFNANGELNDAGELVFDQVNSFYGTLVYSGNVTIPATVLNGNIFIRVVMSYANSPALCGSYSYGSTLDFKVSINGGIASRSLTVATAGNGGLDGDVISSPAGINTSNGINSANFADGTIMTLTATPSNGGSFINWSGDITGTSNPLTFTMNANKNITANFGSPLPADPTSITASASTICSGASSDLTANGAVGTVYWYSGSCNGPLVGSGNPITVSPTSSTIYFASNNNAGNSSLGCASTTVNVNLVPTINNVSNLVSCNGSSTTAVSFTGNNATSFSWTNNNPAIGLAASGSGNIGSFTAINLTTAPITAIITVTPVNSNGGISCYGTPTFYTITVNPTPAVAGSIIGPNLVCKGSEGITFSVEPVINADSYQWSVPAGVVINTGIGTNSIGVSLEEGAGSGIISVYGINDCGMGAVSPQFNLTITDIPLAAGSVSGVNTVCQGTSSAVYSIDAIINATGYTWLLPANATIVNGYNSNAITVDFGLNAVSGNVTVFGTNNCGYGQASLPLEVIVNEKPATAVITNTNSVLHSSATAGNQWFDGERTIEGAVEQTYIPEQNGNYYVIVSVNNCSSYPSNVIEILNVAVTEPKKSIVKIYPNPGNGEFWVENNLKGNEKLLQVKVLDALGRTVYTTESANCLANSKKWIDLSSFPNGIYLLELKTEMEQKSRQIIINH